MQLPLPTEYICTWKFVINRSEPFIHLIFILAMVIYHHPPLPSENKFLLIQKVLYDVRENCAKCSTTTTTLLVIIENRQKLSTFCKSICGLCSNFFHPVSKMAIFIPMHRMQQHIMFCFLLFSISFIHLYGLVCSIQNATILMNCFVSLYQK